MLYKAALVSSYPDIPFILQLSLDIVSSYIYSHNTPAAVIMSGKTRSTGIPKIDADVAKILKMPMRDTEIITQLEEDFPGTTITSNTLEIFVVGAGWNFVSSVLGLVAAGAKVVAYEKNMENIARGEATSLKLDPYFDFFGACYQPLMMPEFSPEQLERLPDIITKIAGDSCYRALMTKRNNILSMGKEQYKNLAASDKISQVEVIEIKKRIIQLLEAAEVLEIINQEVTIDIMIPWLEANKPVFLMTGKETNLEIQGLAHLSETPGFVKDLGEGTESLIDTVLARQRGLQSQGEVQGMPESQGNHLPSVAILGGEEAALKCALELLDRVNPELLRIVYISPEQQSKLPVSLSNARRSMRYELRPGYVSELVLSEDERTITSVKLVGYPDGNVQYLEASLFIHTHNELPPRGGWADKFSSARDSITRLLDEKVPSNGLVRDQAIAPQSESRNIAFRITETWYASLGDDLQMKAMIKDLVDDDKATIIVSGDNPMIRRVIWLAASLKYRGPFYQVSVPPQGPEEVCLQKRLAPKKKNHLWQDVNGQLEEVIVEDSKFKLQIHNWKGETFTSTVDYVINATEKTTKTPLISEMLKNGYIEEDSTGELSSKHPTLSAHYAIFNVWTSDIDSPSVRFLPYAHPRQIQPWGWEDAFDFAKNLHHSSSG